MKKIIYNKFDKSLIASLPIVKFPGKIVVVLNEVEAEKAVDFLLSSDILGVDTETRPTFHKGEMHKVALLQVSTIDICFLFRLNYIGITPAIKKLLENKQIPMIGLSLHDDMLSLHKRIDFKPGYFIDLQNMVGALGIEDLSLQKIYANLFGEKISKRQQLTNWEADVLNDKQKSYASIDAWACIQIYNELLHLEESGDYELVIQPEKTDSIVVNERNRNEV